jgi:lipooligosaccharide transport system permease protein
MSGRSLTGRFLLVWYRNLVVYRRIWKTSFIPPILEPLLYLFAFGAGLGSLVGRLSYAGRELSYTAFIAPALLAINIMYNSFFETTYTSFVRMYYQKTFDAIMATPLSLEEVITGEIAWSATRALLATALMMVVISFFGLLRYPGSLLFLPLALFGGLAFGSIGMFFTSLVPSIETFNLPIFLFITPMFLFSGTFFPLENLPAWAQGVAAALPLTHLVRLSRAFALERWEAGLMWSVLYLAVFTVVFFLLALSGMRRRLVR